MPPEGELILQIDILRTCLREAMTVVRRLECGQKVGKRELLARWAEVVIASGEARSKATGG